MKFAERKRNEEELEISKKYLKMSFKEHEDYVLMPWDDKTTIIVDEVDHTQKAYSRWDFIQKQLKTSEISSVEDLINLIKSYNVQFSKNGEQVKPSWKFNVLRTYFSQSGDIRKKLFFEESGLLWTIRNLALQLSKLVPQLRLLKTGTNSSVKLHQLQIGSILSCAFLCIFPKGRADTPSINFNSLFEGTAERSSEYYIEKLKCLMNYFRRIHKKQPSGNLLFHRLHISDHKFPRWDKTTTALCSFKVEANGKIEDQDGHLQMDFANRYVGGGVLGRGCVQEEIRFLICPELIASRLFTECLASNEALLIIGAERYCNYTGYSNTFAYAGNHEDSTPLDENMCRKTYIIAVDALYFHHGSEQYRESKILRELKKAYVGFKPEDKNNILPLATGNWGCGAFRGDPQLKALLQLMASSQARRDILYLTFGNLTLKTQLEELYSALQEKAVNVGTLYRILRLYSREKKDNQSVFDFVLEKLKTLEERQSPLKSSPSTSRQSTALEFKPRSSKDLPKTRQSFRNSQPDKELENKFPDFKIDFEEMDSEILKYYSSPVRRSPKRERPQSAGLFDLMYSSESKSRCSEEVHCKSMNVDRTSPSLFSDDEMEVCCDDNEGGKKSECNVDKIECEVVEKPKNVRLVQSKITDCFLRK